MRTPDEVDGGGRARLVHGHDRRPVPRDAVAAAERLRERVAERGVDVLDGVMVVHVEVAACHELEIEAGVEGEQRQQVVEEADPGLDARPAVPSSASVSRSAVSVVVRNDRRLPSRRGPGLGSERTEQDVVLGRAPDGDADALRERAHDDSLRLEPLGERLVGPDEDEVRRASARQS